MSTVVQGGTMATRTAEREAMTTDELRVLADQTAHELLGISAAEAFQLLSDGASKGRLSRALSAGSSVFSTRS